MTDPILAPPIATSTTPTASTAEQRIAELEAKLAAVAPLATRGEQALAAERAQLDAKVARLSQADRETVARLSEADRAAVVDRLLASPGSFKMPPLIGGGPPMPSNGPLNIERMLDEPGGIAKLKKDYPDQWQAYCREKSGFSSSTSSGAFFSRAPTAAQKNASARGHRR